MSEGIQRQFYGSVRWQKCRDAYMEYKHGLCEDCMAKGIIRPAEIVHHKIELTPESVNNPSIALSFDNLKAVCRPCHLEEHGRKVRRYMVSPSGEVVTKK